MRIKWDEKAKRLAEKYDLYTNDLPQIEILLEQPNGIKEIGIKTDDDRTIFWYLKDEWIFCK